MKLTRALHSLGPLLLSCFAGTAALGGEVLYNGIELPTQWPPMRHASDVTNGEPMPVPYLKRRPAVVPIDVGRQLFVDDFLIESTTLRRRFHQPVYHPKSPVLRPEMAWEKAEDGTWAAPYSDGVWYDAKAKKFMMFYQGAKRVTCLATSEDGLVWSRPSLDLEPGTNIVLKTIRDTATVWLDHEATDPAARFKLFEARYSKSKWQLALRTSADGGKWSEEIAASGPSWDRSTVFWNPFRQVWVASVRGHDQMKPEPVNRLRCYFEGRTAEAALGWKQHTDEVARGNGLPNDLQPWVAADRLDAHHPDPRYSHIAPQLYNLDAFPYESLMVGLFTLWQGPDNETCKALNMMKRNEVFVGFSRDGFHWDRSSRERFLAVSEDPKAWNATNVQSAGGGCVIVGDQLYFYCSGRIQAYHGDVSTGLATMRRDGFASMDAEANGGLLTTRPVKFAGRHLFVNVAAASGELRVEVLNREGQVIAPFTSDNCVPIRADKVTQRVSWKGDQDLSALAGQQVRFRFHLTKGALHAFWVSANPNGASHGYVAAGGPGFAGAIDRAGE